MFTDKTKVCISIAQSPGKFGVKFHNEGYNLLGLDYLYIPLKVAPSQLKPIIELTRSNFHACSVSMPHKTTVMPLLDELDDTARRVGAVNTILNKDGRLVGYNTDYEGARKAIESTLDINGRQVVMLGAGGVARAMGYAVKHLGGELTVTNRTDHKGLALARDLGCRAVQIKELSDLEGALFINATSKGMNSTESPLEPNSILRYEAIMDAVVGDTSLLKQARVLDKIIISGRTMTAYQAARQFEIYTGHALPKEFIQKFMN